MKLRIGHLSTLYHTSMVLLAGKELIESIPAGIEWKLFGTGPAIVEALRDDELDMAYVGLPPAIIGISQGVRITCVAGGHVEGTVIASYENAYSHADGYNLGDVLSQFNTIGVPGKGAIHDIILMDALNCLGISPRVINFSWSDQILEAFIRGEVDGVVGTPALAQSLIHFAQGSVVYPPHLLWPHNPSYGILVRDEVLLANRESIRDFLVSHKRAAEVLRLETAAVSQVIAQILGVVDEEFVFSTLNVSPRYCAALTDEYILCTMKLTERLRDLGYIERSVRENEIFDLSLIREVHPEPDHY